MVAEVNQGGWFDELLVYRLSEGWLAGLQGGSQN